MNVDVNVPSKSDTGKQKNLEKKWFFIGILKVIDKKSDVRIRKSVVRIRTDPYQNVTDLEHIALC